MAIVAAQDRVAVFSFGERIRESGEVRGRIIVAGTRDTDVFSHHGIAFFLELFPEDFL